MLNVKNLTYAYEREPVLKNISFNIQSQEIVGILGLSGSGKTTLLKILSGLMAPDQGEYTLEGIKAYIGSKRSSAIVTELGVVFQQFNLFPHLSVVDNLILPYRLKTKKGKAECREKAIALLDSLGLSGQADKYPDQCSGGQQQRIAIARALILNPKVLLIDEPTSALDKENTQRLIDMLKQLHNDGLTLILITHDLGFAQALCQRVIELKDGVIESDGPATSYFA